MTASLGLMNIKNMKQLLENLRNVKFELQYEYNVNRSNISTSGLRDAFAKCTQVRKRRNLCCAGSFRCILLHIYYSFISIASYLSICTNLTIDIVKLVQKHLLQECWKFSILFDVKLPEYVAKKNLKFG